MLILLIISYLYFCHVLSEKVLVEQIKDEPLNIESTNENPKKNEIIKRIILAFLAGVIIIVVSIFFYPSNQNDLKKEGLNGKVKSVYESSYKPTEVAANWESTGDAFYTRTMAFDKNGNCTEIKIMDQRIILKYENGVKVEEIRLDEKGNLDYIQKFRLISEKEIESDGYIDGKKVSNIHEFYNKGRLSKLIISDINGTTINETEYSYDNNNNLSEKRTIGKDVDPNFQYSKFKYIEFDEKDNWTQELIFIFENVEKPSAILKRQIEYY